MDEFRSDILKAAQAALDEGAQYARMAGEATDPLRCLAIAIKAERRRCADIVDAECEWGGDIRECERKINSGEGPRRLPGYNAPSAA